MIVFEIIISLFALMVSVFSLWIASIYHKQNKQLNTTMLSLTETTLKLTKQQKQVALLSILAPACDSPDAWSLLLKYLNKNNALPDFEAEDYQTMDMFFNRMCMKIKIAEGKLEVD